LLAAGRLPFATLNGYGDLPVQLKYASGVTCSWHTTNLTHVRATPIFGAVARDNRWDVDDWTSAQRSPPLRGAKGIEARHDEGVVQEWLVLAD
jgi:hypothetical protein